MPTDIVFSTGASLKVISAFQDVADAMAGGGGTMDAARFAGFRGEEAVAGERVLVNLATIAYLTEIPGP